MKTRRVRTRGGRECYATKKAHECVEGPWKGERIFLSSDSDGATAWVQFGQHVGRYVHGCWQPLAA